MKLTKFLNMYEDKNTFTLIAHISNISASFESHVDEAVDFINDREHVLQLYEGTIFYRYRTNGISKVEVNFHSSKYIFENEKTGIPKEYHYDLENQFLNVCCYLEANFGYVIR